MGYNKSTEEVMGYFGMEDKSKAETQIIYEVPAVIPEDPEEVGKLKSKIESEIKKIQEASKKLESAKRQGIPEDAMVDQHSVLWAKQPLVERVSLLEKIKQTKSKSTIKIPDALKKFSKNLNSFFHL